ncbi:hypothetical protein [Streptomyces sp. NBC_01508]|uniref:hypothetical protein n=1 Tax=Streptomyces sp. NBC_01508 TaxID=2903888 RepID=UPI00386CC3A5
MADFGKGEFSRMPPPGPDAQAATLWRLTVDPELPLQGVECRDELDEAWLKLAESIPQGKHVDTEESLQVVADFWIQEDEDWGLFHPRSYPCFDPYVCAVAALACRGGYSPRKLSADALKFLDPGLVPPNADSPRSA